MDDIEVPQYFICPISLQIMKDPVTAITGITYDRESIEHWLFIIRKPSCPVTKQPLPLDSELTPNHILRKFIQSWCTANSSNGIDRIPTPKSPIGKFHIVELLESLHHPHLVLQTLKKLELIAKENVRNLKYMVEANVPKSLFHFIVTCFKGKQLVGIEEALNLLLFIRVSSSERKRILDQNELIIDSLTWVLCVEIENHRKVKSNAVLVLRKIIELANSTTLERLNPNFFRNIIDVVTQGIEVNAALKIMLHTSSLVRNRIMMGEAGAVFKLIEIQLNSPEKRTTELIFGLLFHLCCCANGRAEFLNHRGGIAMISERILSVTPVVDDLAVKIVSVICKFCGNDLVINEMLKLGVLSKLCIMIEVDCGRDVKEKAREILRLISDDRKSSPCFNVSRKSGGIS